MTEAHVMETSTPPRRGFIRNLDFKKKAIGGGAAAGIFVLGFIADTALSEVKEAFFPDQAEARALVIQENLDKKAASIEALSESIQERLVAMGAEPGLADDTQQLLSAIDDLRPDIYAAADLNRSSVTRLLAAKSNSVTSTGSSDVSDFDLSSDTGATVCRAGYTLGISETSSIGSLVGRLSGGGESARKTLQPGDTISLDTSDGGLVAVNYRGFTDQQNGVYGFDVDCR